MPNLALSAEKHIAELATALNQANTSFQRNAADYTEAGKAKRWAQLTGRHAETLNKAENFVDNHPVDAENKVAKIRQELMPVASNDQATVAAELGAQRILQRHTDLKSIMDMIAGMEPSPTRTTVLDELVARKEITADTVEAFLDGASPDYDAAKFAVVRAHQVQMMLRQRITILRSWIEKHPSFGTQMLTNPFLDHVSVSEIEDRPKYLNHVAGGVAAHSMQVGR